MKPNTVICTAIDFGLIASIVQVEFSHFYGTAVARVSSIDYEHFIMVI